MRHYTPRINCVCEQCGKPFSVQKAVFEKRGAKYCTQQCATEARKTKIDCTCLQCGKIFKEYISGIKRGQGKYCSKKCWSIAQRNQIECICPICHKNFSVKAYRGKERAIIYCSKRCYAVGQSLLQRGSKSHFWRGGIGRNAYRGENWNQQRKAAYARDKGECQYCGRKPQKGKRKFQVHHIKPLREFNGDYVAANQLTNLITLCHQCHGKAEHGKIFVQPYLF